MRRKLISFNAFNEVEKNSLTYAEAELTEAENILADALELESLSLHCYDQENAYYETADGNFIHAVYELEDGVLKFESLEEVVVDTDSFNENRRKLVSEMIDSIVSGDDLKAEDRFVSYVEMMLPKLKLQKGSREKDAVAKRVSNEKSNLKESANPLSNLDVKQRNVAPDPKKSAAAKKGHGRNPDAAKKGWEKRRKHKHKIDSAHKSGAWKAADAKVDVAQKTSPRARKKGVRYDEMQSWDLVARNVLDYVDHVTKAPVLENIQIERDDLENITKLTMPTAKLRNEGKLLAIKWDTLKTDVKVMREQAMRLSLDEEFQRAVSQIKRLNNLSDAEQLDEKMSSLAGNYPSVLYLTQAEMSKIVAESLKNIGATNYDDQICEFIAEGILRVAFNSYPERVNRLSHLAGANLREDGDSYLAFQEAIASFYPSVDEQMAIETRVFEDLHNIFLEVRKFALETDHDTVRKHASDYLMKLEGILTGKSQPNLSLAEECAAYLTMFVETNLAGSEWGVVKTPYRTNVGEHPDMVKKAQHPYAPSRDFSGDWGSSAPVSDGKSYRSGLDKEMRDHGWGSKGGKDTYPSLNNPYVPSHSGNWTMKGEKGVDKGTDDGLGQYQSSDTWPELTNPYLPNSVKRHANTDNRVDDVESKVGLKQTSDLNQHIS